MEQHHRGDGDHLILSSFDERFCAAQPIELFIFQGTRAHTPRYVLGGAHCHVGARFACAITSLVQQVHHDVKSLSYAHMQPAALVNKSVTVSLHPA